MSSRVTSTTSPSSHSSKTSRSSSFSALWSKSWPKACKTKRHRTQSVDRFFLAAETIHVPPYHELYRPLPEPSRIPLASFIGRRVLDIVPDEKIRNFDNNLSGLPSETPVYPYPIAVDLNNNIAVSVAEVYISQSNFLLCHSCPGMRCN